MTIHCRIALIGLGDLGSRIALALATSGLEDELVLIGRSRDRGEQLARLVSSCADAPVRYFEANALDSRAMSALIERERPDIILQCASLMSPWLLSERADRAAQCVLDAGFAVQLPAQLPAIAAVMRAVRSCGYAGPVVNCSYPDVTHPVLAAVGLAPTLGVGNAGMVLRLIKAALRSRGESRQVHVLAHHAHVAAVAACDGTLLTRKPGPRVFVDECEISPGEWVYGYPPLSLTRDLNALTAAHTVEVIRSLRPQGPRLRTAVPGPSGLPGGWPVSIHDGVVELDLPSGLTQAEVIRFNVDSAAADGIERIDCDGTVFFTDRAKAAVAPVCRELAEPLRVDEALERSGLLQRVLSGDGRAR